MNRGGLLRYAGRALAALLAAAFVGLLAYGLLSQADDTTIDDSLARAQAVPAPGFDLRVLEAGDASASPARRLPAALADGRLALRELRGMPVVLNLWASWCLPCREEARVLQAAWVVERPRGVAFLELNMQDITDDARAFLREFGATYPNVREGSNAVARRYGATGLPETFFISARGEVVGHVIGVVSPAQLRDGVRAAVAGRPRGAVEGGERRSTR